MRLLFVTSGLTRGGAEGFLVRLATRLATQGHAVGVAAFGSRAPLAPPLEASGVEVVSLGGGALGPMLRLARFARRFRPEALQGWMYRGNLAALAAARLLGRDHPVIWSVRQGLNDLAESPWPTRALIAVCARLSGRPYAIAYNAHSAERQHAAAGFDSARSRVIPNGIDLPATWRDARTRASARLRLGLTDDAFVVVMLARWHPVKNHRGFARAAGLFARWHPQARFLLAGDGIDSANAALVSWLREERIEDRVLLLGERSDVPELLAASDVATLSSVGEALPNALLEAMASGIPCVAPDVGDLAALIATTGRIVPPNDPAALAAGWRAVAAMTPGARAALGDDARARVAARYALDRAVEAFETLYLAAAGG